MKIKIREHCGYMDVEAESPKDFYTLGRIAQKFGTSVYNSQEPKTIEIPLDKVLKVLAE